MHYNEKTTQKKSARVKWPEQAKWLEQVDQFIEANIHNHSLTVATIAHAVFISERQFYRKIKEVTGQTPNHYLQVFRLKKAREYLQSGDFSSVKDVAFSVGYSRSDYFSKIYETHFGHRPVYYFEFKLKKSS